MVKYWKNEKCNFVLIIIVVVRVQSVRFRSDFLKSSRLYDG